MPQLSRKARNGRRSDKRLISATLGSTWWSSAGSRPRMTPVACMSYLKSLGHLAQKAVGEEERHVVAKARPVVKAGIGVFVILVFTACPIAEGLSDNAVLVIKHVGELGAGLLATTHCEAIATTASKRTWKRIFGAVIVRASTITRRWGFQGSFERKATGSELGT
jgi:hypothetical protein